MRGTTASRKPKSRRRAPKTGSAPLCFSATVPAIQSGGTMEYYVDYIWQDGLLSANVASNSKQKVKFTKYNFAPQKKKGSKRTNHSFTAFFKIVLVLKNAFYFA